MADATDHKPAISRRAAIATLATAGVAATGAAFATAGRDDGTNANSAASATGASGTTESLHGRHQPGIATPQQQYALFAAFDLQTADPAGGKALPTERIAASFQQLMQRWSETANRLMSGRPPGPIPGRKPGTPDNSGIADGLAPAGLTFTFGFGPALFEQIGRIDRRPSRLRELPDFTGDRLDPAWSGGQLLIQICADDPQVVSHAFRTVRAQAPGLARLRWSQHGFLGSFGGATPRNLFGHKDGTSNPRPGTAAFDEAVWTGPDEPAWFDGGTYLVFRKIRFNLPKWDLSTAAEQDTVIGRHRDSGAPLSGGTEFTAPDLDRRGPDGKPMIAPDSHVALMHGIPMLRRSYNYDYGMQAASAGGHDHGGDGHSHGGELEENHAGNSHNRYDSGVLFCAYLRDPAEFVTAQHKLAADRLNAFVHHTGSAVFAIPPGIQPGRHLGSPLA